MIVAVDRGTGKVVGQVVDINALTGMIRVLCRGGGYRSIMSEYVRLEKVS